jgi:hypothetical protein
MAADIYTKAFVDGLKWQVVCELVNIIDPSILRDLSHVQDLVDNAPSLSRGVPQPLRPQRVFRRSSVGMRTSQGDPSKLLKIPDNFVHPIRGTMLRRGREELLGHCEKARGRRSRTVLLGRLFRTQRR